MRQSSRVRVLSANIVLLVGCGGGITPPPPPLPPTPVITVAATPVTLAPGEAGTSTITVGRTNYTGPIDLSLERAPQGVSGTFSPSSVPNPSTSSTLSISTTSGVLPNSLSLTVRATATGAAAATATLPLVVSADLTVRTGSIPIEAAVRDAVYDADRNLLFLAEPTISEIGIFSLATLSYIARLTTGTNRVTGLDLSGSGDSLLVSLPQSRTVGIVKLRSGLTITDTIRITFDGFQNRRPDQLRVMANGKVMISLTFDGTGFGGQLYEYDLATRAQKQRTEVGLNQSITEATHLVRSADRRRRLLLIDDSCCPLSRNVYTSATDVFTTLLPTVNQFFPSVSTNADGSRFLINATLFSNTLIQLQQLTVPGHQSEPTAISSDATTGYVAVSAAVQQVRLSDGVVTKSIPTEGTAVRILALPADKGVVIFTPTKVHVVTP